MSSMAAIAAASVQRATTAIIIFANTLSMSEPFCSTNQVVSKTIIFYTGLLVRIGFAIGVEFE
jgi:hypothetical protein